MVVMLTLSLQVDSFSFKTSFSRLWGGQCHREPTASQAIHWRCAMFLVDIPSSSDLGFAFLFPPVSFCLLPGKGWKLLPCSHVLRSCLSGRDCLDLSTSSPAALTAMELRKTVGNHRASIQPTQAKGGPGTPRTWHSWPQHKAACPEQWQNHIYWATEINSLVTFPFLPRILHSFFTVLLCTGRRGVCPVEILVLKAF